MLTLHSALCKQQTTDQTVQSVHHDLIMEKQIKRFKTYEDYLDSLMVEDDQKYLGDVETARQLVQLGYRSSGKTLSFQEFWQMKEEVALSQGFGMKNLTNSSPREATERLEEGEGSCLSTGQSGLPKLLCDRYQHIVTGRDKHLPRTTI